MAAGLLRAVARDRGLGAGDYGEWRELPSCGNAPAE